MRTAEIEIKINIARREMQFWQGVLADKRCGNCTEYVQDVCQKYNAEPPGKAREPGCDDWDWDQIPFN